MPVFIKLQKMEEETQTTFKYLLQNYLQLKEIKQQNLEVYHARVNLTILQYLTYF